MDRIWRGVELLELLESLRGVCKTWAMIHAAHKLLIGILARVLFEPDISQGVGWSTVRCMVAVSTTSALLQELL